MASTALSYLRWSCQSFVLTKSASRFTPRSAIAARMSSPTCCSSWYAAVSSLRFFSIAVRRSARETKVLSLMRGSPVAIHNVVNITFYHRYTVTIITF